MDKLSQIEKEDKILLPQIYKDFYRRCSRSIPENLVGTDLRNHYPDMNIGAIELLEEDGAEIFLESDDFVFMMHQGYIFWYFKANGDPDPDVFGYYQGKIKPDNLGRLSEFLKRYRA